MTRERLHPGTLSRDRIVEVALDIAQREGPEALSMRRIATELGTGAMSLYNHVPDKAALLEALSTRVLAEVEVPREATWQEMTRAWAASLRGTLLRHRAVGPVVISAGQARPLQFVSQNLVEALIASGRSPDDSRQIMRIAGRFVAGSVMLDSVALHHVPDADMQGLDEVFELGLGALIDGLDRSLTPTAST